MSWFEKPDAYVIFLEYTPAHRETGLAVLRPFVRRVLPRHRARWIVVDNACARDEEVAPLDGADTIAGENSSREFSGLDKGIEHVRRKYRPAASSAFVLVNDTFHRSYGTDYLERFRRRKVLAALHSNQAVGYVDCYPSDIEVLGLPVRCWIRTSLVLLPSAVLDVLGALAIPIGNERIFGGGVDRFFREDAPLSENYRRYLRAWLFGEEGRDFNERWHSRAPLTEANLADFVGKARSILCEHYLSARMRSRGMGIFKVN